MRLHRYFNHRYETQDVPAEGFTLTESEHVSGLITARSAHDYRGDHVICGYPTKKQAIREEIGCLENKIDELKKYLRSLKRKER